MIDTQRNTTRLQLRPDMEKRVRGLTDRESSLPTPPWGLSAMTREGINGESVRIFHRISGLKAWAAGPIVTAVEASLSRLYFGHNGELIKNQRELDGAREALERLLSEIAFVDGGIKGALSRLDLVLHLPIPPARLLPVLKHARHPKVRRDTEVYNSTTVTFPGSRLRITAYDKSVEMKRGRGLVTRLEFSLKNGDAIKELLGHRNFEALRFDECYAAYRSLVLGFDLPPEPASNYSEPGLIASCEHLDFRPTGISVSDWALEAKKPRARRQLQREIAKQMCGLRRIDLAALMPEDGPLPDCLISIVQTDDA